jgi:hypothetical protein
VSRIFSRHFYLPTRWEFSRLCLLILHICRTVLAEILTSAALCSVLLTKYHSGDQVKKTEVGRTCGTYGGKGEVHTGL